MPLLELSDCKRAEESVRAAWSLRGSGSTKRLRALKWGSEEWWQQQEVMWLSANPEQMWPVVKACGRTGGEKVRDRLKKARKTGAADKRKLPDLLLSDWLFFGLWLFSDEAGVALLRAVHGFGVSSVTYADTVRHQIGRAHV